MAMLPPIAYGVWVVLGTASRGCMLALVAMFLFTLFRSTPRQRAVTLAFGLIMVVTIPFLLTGNVRARLGTLFGDGNIDPGLAAEAQESRSVREYLFRQSVRYTVMHPVFGVGVGQFTSYEGNESTQAGRRGQWSVTHNFMTQISSETGIMGLVFVLLSLGTSWLMVGRTYKQAKKRGFTEIANACFCYQLAMVGYLCSIVFLAQAYHFYMPMMVGLAIAMTTVANRYMAAQQTPLPAPAPALPFAVR
jgi:O-antigen ligase